MSSAVTPPGEPARVDRDPRARPPGTVDDDRAAVPADRYHAEKARFGGMRFGTAFFGWLTATGTSAILAAIVSAVGVGLGVGTGVDADDVSRSDAQAIGLGGSIALVAIAFVGYLAGGYVAGRMARFSGAKQGVAVWLWAIVVAVVLAIAGFIAGARFNALGSLGGVPRIPDAAGLTVAGIVVAAAVILVALLGAVLGGLAGMRYHRRVDREGDTAAR